MERSRLGKPSLSQYKEARPVDPVFLAPSANGTPPESKHPIAEHAQTREVSWYRVVVEVALDDRLEPLSGLGTGSCMRSLQARTHNKDASRERPSAPNPNDNPSELDWRRRRVQGSRAMATAPHTCPAARRRKLRLFRLSCNGLDVCHSAQRCYLPGRMFQDEYAKCGWPATTVTRP
jgi:hypothetical protein